MSIININLGDWSGDGHNKTFDNLFTCNRDFNTVITAYKKGCKKLGFVLHDKVAANYDDGSITQEQLDKLLSLGFNNKIQDLDYLQDEDLVELFIFTAKLGNSELLFIPAVSEVQEVFGYGGLDGNFGYGIFTV